MKEFLLQKTINILMLQKIILLCSYKMIELIYRFISELKIFIVIIYRNFLIVKYPEICGRTLKLQLY